MRDQIVDTLGDLAHSQFLVYLMGPYKAFDIKSIFEQLQGSGTAPDPDTIPAPVDFGTLVDSDIDLDQREAVLDLLLDVRDQLRTDPGVNAFLAIDIDIPLEEMDGATQSIEFATASNVVIYIVPKIGDNLGVGIEVGSVLEVIFRERSSETGEEQPANRHERVAFVHEAGVRSAMIASVRDRWDARIYSYTDRDDLVSQVRLFTRDIARRELRGELQQLSGSFS